MMCTEQLPITKPKRKYTRKAKLVEQTYVDINE